VGGLLCWESSAQKSAQNLRDSNCRQDCLSSELAHLFASNVSVQLTEVEGRRICYPAKLPLDFKSSNLEEVVPKSSLKKSAYTRRYSTHSQQELLRGDAFSVPERAPQGALAGRLEDRKPLQPVARTFILTEHQIRSRLTLQVRILPPLESADLARVISSVTRIIS
jgi:hypothetical protein